MVYISVWLLQSLQYLSLQPKWYLCDAILDVSKLINLQFQK